MKARRIAILAFVVSLASALLIWRHLSEAVPAEPPPRAAAARPARVRSLAIPFVENRGQITAGGVRYYAPASRQALFVTQDGHLIYALAKSDAEEDAAGWAIEEHFVGASISQVKNPAASCGALPPLRCAGCAAQLRLAVPLRDTAMRRPGHSSPQQAVGHPGAFS